MTATKKAPARGRPRGFDADQAVDTAMRLFHARGYDAVGVAEITGALGIKPPSFYAAFGSKAGLFARTLARYGAGEANVFERARGGGGGVAAVIERTFDNAARCYPARDGLAGCLVLDAARTSGDAEARALAAAVKAQSRAAIRDFIATEYPERAAALAEFVTIALAGMSGSARDGDDGPTLARFAEAAKRALRAELAAQA